MTDPDAVCSVHRTAQGQYAVVVELLWMQFRSLTISLTEGAS